jgi:hypothetical protein
MSRTTQNDARWHARNVWFHCDHYLMFNEIRSSVSEMWADALLGIHRTELNTATVALGTYLTSVIGEERAQDISTGSDSQKAVEAIYDSALSHAIYLSKVRLIDVTLRVEVGASLFLLLMKLPNQDVMKLSERTIIQLTEIAVSNPAMDRVALQRIIRNDIDLSLISSFHNGDNPQD